jgi:hypothetical protein
MATHTNPKIIPQTLPLDLTRIPSSPKQRFLLTLSTRRGSRNPRRRRHAEKSCGSCGLVAVVIRDGVGDHEGLKSGDGRDNVEVFVVSDFAKTPLLLPRCDDIAGAGGQ